MLLNKLLLIIFNFVVATKAIDTFLWEDRTIVHLKDGSLKGGLYKKHKNELTTAFLGVPYARPPLGPLRFRPTEKLLPWDGIKTTTNFPPECTQASSPAGLTMSEDCLHLNLFVPGNLSDTGMAKRKLPVLVWIHGGGFQFDSASRYTGRVITETQRIITVSINYRLNVLGFLSTESPAAAGNYGLLDQQMAMTWVRDNIANFGGDPNRVTIGGLSAGGHSVAMHLLSPGSRGLFQRAITMSGSPLGAGVHDINARGKALKLADILNCSRPTHWEAVQCLRGINVQELTKAASLVINGMDVFDPVVSDGLFLTGHPRKMIDEGQLPSNVSILSGLTNFESTFFYGTEAMAVMNENDFTSFVKKNTPLKSIDAIIPSIVATYGPPPGYKSNDTFWKKAALDIMSDQLYVAGTLHVLNGMIKKGNEAYFYLFTHRPSVSPVSDISQRPAFITSSHADDKVYGLGYEALNPNATELERNLSMAMVESFGNFVKTGNPSMAHGVKWEPYTSDHKYYLRLSAEMSAESLSEDLWSTRTTFWNSVVPELQELRETSSEAPGPVVACPSGSVRGHRVVMNGLEWEEFYGLPYAKPPTGQLRFRAPQKHPGWEGVRDAMAFRERCYTDPDEPLFVYRTDVLGRGGNFSEDCLFLNVYVPKSVEESRKEPKAVLVWIHGGGFLIGDTVTFVTDGSIFAPYNDVILVTVAYRLGPLGFLTTKDSHAPGNYGLQDQQMALQWVQENIAAFGGDPKRVTIYGESAGSTAVHFQVLNPISRTYFQRAISSSGTAVDPWVLRDYTTGVSINLTQSLGCPTEDHRAWVNCLRSKDIEEIQNKTDYKMPGDKRFSWLPVVDGFMVRDNPRKMAEAGEGSTIEYMVGLNNAEPLAQAEMAVLGMLNPDNKTVDQQKYDDLIANALAAYFEGNEATKTAINNEYFLNFKYTKEECIEAFTRLATDQVLLSGCALALKESAKHGGKVYQYQFSHDSVLPLLTLFAPFNLETEGALHADDLLYSFGVPLMSHVPRDLFKFRPEDRRVSELFMHFIANFAKTGDPSTPLVKWPAYGLATQQYMDIQPEPEVKVSLHARRVALWNDVIPSLLQKNEHCEL